MDLQVSSIGMLLNDLEEIQSEVIEGNDDSYNKANEAAFKRITSTYGAGQMTDDEFVSLIDKYIDKEWLALKDEELTKDIFFTTTDENGKEIVDEEGFEEFKKKLKKIKNMEGNLHIFICVHNGTTG